MKMNRDYFDNASPEKKLRTDNSVADEEAQSEKPAERDIEI